MTEPRHRRPRRRKERPPMLVRAVRSAVWATSAVVLIASGATWAAYRTITDGLTTSDALDTARKHAPRHLDSSVNLLLIGLDSRKDMDGNDLPKEFVQDQLHAGSSEIGYYNTNTLILMHIPADGGKVTAFSVPRDDYVETLYGDGTSQGHHKIKEAYSFGYTKAHDKLSADGVKGPELEHRSREAGREATLTTVQRFLGVPVDHFAEVNLLGFYDIAKVLQPIEVCLKHPVRDRYSGADFPAGPQKLNPKQALAFVRQRHGLDGGDLDRTRRQQAFIASVTHRLKSQGVFDDLGKLRELFDVVKKDLVLDSSWDVLDFARRAPDLTGGHVEFRTLPITRFATRGGESVNLVDPEQIRRTVASLTTGGGSPSPGASPSGSADAKGAAGEKGTAGAKDTAGEKTKKPAPSGVPSSTAPSPTADDGSDATVKAGGVPCVD